MHMMHMIMPIFYCSMISTDFKYIFLSSWKRIVSDKLPWLFLSSRYTHKEMPLIRKRNISKIVQVLQRLFKSIKNEHLHSPIWYVQKNIKQIFFWIFLFFKNSLIFYFRVLINRFVEPFWNSKFCPFKLSNKFLKFFYLSFLNLSKIWLYLNSFATQVCIPW